MNMIGTTNLIMFDLINELASKNIKNPIVENGCGRKND